MKYPNIDAERARKGISNDLLAEQLGVSRKTLYNWMDKGTERRNQMEEMMNVETMALTAAQESGEKVRIFIVNGYQIQAEIIDFDANVILVKENGRKKMIYRTAISTIEF